MCGLGWLSAAPGDGSKVASGSGDKALKVWSGASLELLAEKQGAHGGWISSVAFSGDGSKVASGSMDKALKVWDASSLVPLCVFYAPSPITAVAMHERRLVAGSDRGDLHHLELYLEA